jgi:tetratricopeptide (TPR) repeat protein
VVHLKNGGSLEGQVTLTDDGAVIKLPVGEIRVSKDAIARIEKKESAIEEYIKRATTIKEDDPEAHYQLGLWARGAGLKAQANDEFAKTLALKPDHEGAHQALGHRKVDGRWMSPDDEMRAKGLVQRDGQWMTPEAAARLDALKAELDAARAKREAAEAALRRAAQPQPQPLPAPAYTYDAYYSTRPLYSSYYTTVPYYGYSYGYGYTYPYTYVSPWPSFYYARPYPYYWPSVGISLGWYHGGSRWSHYGGGSHWPSHGGSHGGPPHGGPRR